MNHEGDAGICKENQKTITPDSQKESGLILPSPPAKMNHAGSPSHSKEGGGGFLFVRLNGNLPTCYE